MILEVERTEEKLVEQQVLAESKLSVGGGETMQFLGDATPDVVIEEEEEELIEPDEEEWEEDDDWDGDDEEPDYEEWDDEEEIDWDFEEYEDIEWEDVEFEEE